MPGKTEFNRRSVLDARHSAMQQAPTQMPAGRKWEPTSGDASRGGHRPAEQPHDEHSYYDISFLKPPVWKWEIASYFFLGGLSAGAYVLSRMAEYFGGERYRDLRRAGTAIAFAGVIPAAPLLIHDLGDPKRFHHMLRIFKPSSPMNLGTWTMTAYSGAAAAALGREWLRGRRTRGSRTAITSARDAVLLLVCDAAGVPLALLLAGYTGVLLSSTATPMWSKNPWIGALFSASAMASGAAAINLALAATGSDPQGDSMRALERVDRACHVAEAITLAGYLKRAGPLARPLTRGSMKRHLWGSVAAVLGSEVLRLLPFRGAARRRASIASSLLGLAGAFSLRWAFVYGAHESAKDPHDARLSSRPPPGQGKFPMGRAAGSLSGSSTAPPANRA